MKSCSVNSLNRVIDMQNIIVCNGKHELFKIPQQHIEKLINIGSDIKDKYPNTSAITSKHSLQLGICKVLSDRFHD